MQESKKELQTRVFALIAKTLKFPIEEIKLDDEIIDLCTDSIQLFELLTAFEDDFKQSFEYEEVIELKTVRDILEYLERKDIGK